MLCANSILLASDHFRYGRPFIQHFTKKEYKGGNKSWSLTQDDHGFIYVGNSNGLLQYDGQRWTKYTLPSATIVRSIFAHKDRIYSGSLGEIGYWEKDKNFNLHYNSLNHLLADHEFGDEEIWWITEYQGYIIFQSFANTYVYDGEQIQIILSGKGVLFPPFVVNGELHIQVLDSGLYKAYGTEMRMISNSDMFIGKRINCILPMSNASGLLIGTAEHGFYSFDGARFERWETSNDEAFIRDQINRGIAISTDLYAIGTLLGGIYIMNGNGEVLNQINNRTGLNNNTILSLLLDKSGNLWVGMDNGIDYVRVNSPLYYNTDFTGELGSVYTAAMYRGDLYLGTNRGVFHTRFNQQENTGDLFKFIPGSQEQVWCLTVIDDQLFCGHNTSTFIIKDYQLNKIANISGGYDLKIYPYDDQYLIQGSYNGLAIFQKAGGSWQYSHMLPGFNRLSKFIDFERENVLWVAHTHRGLYRLELDDDLRKITEIRSFSENSKTYINKVNKRLVFSSDSGFVYYDDIQNTFYPLNEINESLGQFARNAHIVPEVSDYYWIFKEGDCARVLMDENSVGEIDNHVLNDLSEFLIPGFEDLYVVDSTFSIIFLDNGYAIFNNSWEDHYTDNEPRVFVKSLSFHTLSGDTYNNMDLLSVPFRFNNIRLKVSYPEFTGEQELVYRLLGYDERWLRTDGVEDITFQNLPFGDYAIAIKPEGNDSAETITINFSINPPWYNSATSRMIYFLVAVVSIMLFIVLNRRKIKRIHDKHELERKRLLEKEAAETERKLVEMRNENLRNELKLRNSRLAKSTFSLIHKNSTLISVKEELIKIKDELGVRFPSKHFRRLIRNIDSDLTSEKDWRMFEQSFSEVHEHFLHKIKEQHPELTPSDLQLCAYLKLNLSSKEMASLLNITVRGVEIRRYRLRKKLDMEHDTNLTEYIMGY